jgi:hypothetical protein
MEWLDDPTHPRYPAGFGFMVQVLVLLTTLLVANVEAQGGAKALFYGSTSTMQSPMSAVGIHYWFENAKDPIMFNEVDLRFTEPGAAGAGARVRLHVQTNTSGFLSVWLIDDTQDGARLTPLDGRASGYQIAGRREQVIPREIAVPAKPGSSMIILFARSQMEQVGSPRQARDKLRRISATRARDGGPVIVAETDTTTPGQIGTYIVHREGAQPAVEIELGR